MLYSKSSQYAIRSVAFLASLPKKQICGIDVISRTENIPKHFLAKIMRRLIKHKIVRSYKGINGGFALNQAPQKITLLMIVDAIDGVSESLSECMLGQKVCNDLNSCGLHDSWSRLRSKYIAFLEKVTVADLAKQLKEEC